MKRTLSILMIVMIVMMFVIVSIIPVDAMMPIVPLAGALTKQQVVTGVLVSLNMISLTESAPDIIDDILSLPQFLNFNSNDYPLVYTPDGEYAFMIGKEQLDAIYYTVTGDIPYGTTVSHGVLSDYANYFGQIPELFVNSYTYNGYVTQMKSLHDIVIVQLVDYNRVQIYGLKSSITAYLQPNSTTLRIKNADSTYLSKILLVLKYDGTLESGGTITTQSETMGITIGEIVYSNCSLIIPETVWDENYIKPTGINYSTWPQQVSGGYAIKIPTKNEIDPITDNEIAVVDEDTLVTLLPDDVRVPDRVTEVVPQTDPIPVNPYDPTIPVTDPVTDPITDVASETWLDRLLHKFVNLFILPENYFTEQFQSIQNEIPMLAFPNQIIADLRSMSTLGPYYLDDITVNAWGGTHTIVSFQGLRDALPTVHNWIRGFIFILLLLYNYSQVYKAIRGNDYGFALHQSNTATPDTSLSKEVINR